MNEHDRIGNGPWYNAKGVKIAGRAQVGHHEREGRTPEGVSWNSVHPSRGRGTEDLKASGSDGALYCFAVQ